jgi:hypothetical protein
MAEDYLARTTTMYRIIIAGGGIEKRFYKPDQNIHQINCLTCSATLLARTTTMYRSAISVIPILLVFVSSAAPAAKNVRRGIDNGTCFAQRDVSQRLTGSR